MLGHPGQNPIDNPEGPGRMIAIAAAVLLTLGGGYYAWFGGTMPDLPALTFASTELEAGSAQADQASAAPVAIKRLHTIEPRATYVIDVCFMRPELDEYDIVVDIGLATDVVKETLSSINYRNLDEHPDFTSARSTTEAVARWIFERLQEAITAGRLGPSAAGLTRLKITLNESHAARAGYEADLVRA